MSEVDKPLHLIRLGLYLGLSNLAHIAIGVTDVLMAGALGSYQLAAATLAATLYQVVMLLGIGFSIGVGPLLSRYQGAKEDEAFHGSMIAAILCLFIVVLLSTAFLFWGDWLLILIGQDRGLIEESQDYLFFLTVALPVGSVFGFLWMLASLKGQGHCLFWISFVSIFVNALGNYVFMFGIWGAEPMGLAGLGVSTLTTLALKTVFLYGWLRLKGALGVVRCSFQDIQKAKLYVRDVLRYGVPMMVLEGATLAFFAVLTFIVGILGPVSLAAHAITLQLAEIGTGLAFGFSEAISIVIARYVGQKNWTAVRKSFKQAVLFGSGAMIVYGIFLITFGENLVPLFLDQSDAMATHVTRTVLPLILIAAICLIVDSARIVFVGILRGLDDTHVPIFITMGSFWLCAIPMAFILGVYTDLTVKGIWIGLAFGMAIASILLMKRFVNFWNVRG